MDHSVKNLFKFLLPYVIGLFILRLGLDILIKQMQWGYKGESIGGMIALGIILIIIFITINNYKKLIGDKLLFSQGVRVGVALMLLVGILFSIYVVIHGKFIDPAYQENLAKEVAKLTKTKFIPQKNNLLIGLGFSIMRYVLIGAFGAIISSAILKTEK